MCVSTPVLCDEGAEAGGAGKEGEQPAVPCATVHVGSLCDVPLPDVGTQAHLHRSGDHEQASDAWSAVLQLDVDVFGVCYK